jgi:hypothetical protein
VIVKEGYLQLNLIAFASVGSIALLTDETSRLSIPAASVGIAGDGCIVASFLLEWYRCTLHARSMTDSGRSGVLGEYNLPTGGGACPMVVRELLCRLVGKAVRLGREEGVGVARGGGIHLLEEHDRALSVVAIDELKWACPEE